MASEDSISNGVESLVILASFFFLEGDAAALSVGVPRFLDTRFEAFSTCFAIFSSLKISIRTVTSVLERASALHDRQLERQKPLLKTNNE